MTLKTLNRTVAVLALLGLSACSNGMFGSGDNDDDDNRAMQNSSVLNGPGDATSSGGINGEVNSTGVGGANAGSASGNVGGFSGTGAGSAAD